MKIGFKRLTMLLALLSVVMLAACGKTDTTLKDAVADLTITYASGDSISAVTKDLPTLPAKVGEVTITWASNNTAVLSAAGKVTRPASDTVVTLTATLTFDGKTESKEFKITVKAVEGPTQAEKDAATAALQAAYADTIGDVTYEVIADLELVSTISGFSVTWASANTALIAVDGKVTRPAYTVDGGQAVKLTATITVKGEAVEVEFFAFVKGMPKTVQQTLTEAVNLGAAFTSDVSTDGITTDQTLQTSVKYEDVTYTIVWTSSHPETMGADGKVVRPALGQPDLVVTMTASITHEGVTVTKDVEFKVLSYKPSRVFETIGDLYTGDERAKDGEYVKVKGVKVLGKIKDGIFLHDGTDILYVFDRNKVIYESLVPGKVYDVEGEFDIYYSAGQIANYAPNVLTFVESSEEVGDLVATERDYKALIDGLSLPTNPNELTVFYEYTRFTAKVLVDAQEGATSSYKYWLVPTDYEGETVISKLDKPVDGKAIQYATKYVSNIYYQSNSEAFAALNGKTVTIDFLMYGFRSDRYVWYGLFFDDVTDIVVAFDTDAEALAAAKAVVEKSQPADVVEAKTLDLVKSIHGASVKWSSNNEEVINSTTGVVTPVDGVVTKVELTAVITLKDLPAETVKININVGELPVKTVKEVIDSAKGAQVRFEATVFEYDGRGNVYVSNGTDSLVVRISSSSDLHAALVANKGKKVEVIGTTDLYSGLVQVAPTKVTAKGAGDAIAPINADALELSKAGLISVQSSLVELTGMSVTSRKTTESTDSKGVTYNTVSIILTQVASSKTIELRWDDRVVLTTEAKAELDKLVVDAVVDVTTVLGWHNNPQLLALNVLKVTVTPQDNAAKLAADAAAIKDIALTAAGAIELPALGANGSAISYAFKDAAGANNSLIDLVAKTVTMPSEGQVVVTLVATLTLSEEAAVKVEIDVTLGTAPVQPNTAFAVYSFASQTGTGTKIDASFESVVEASLVTGGTDYLTSVTGVANVYSGNGDSGTYPNQGGFVKVGKSKENGTFTLNFTGISVSKVVIYAEKWNEAATDTLAINGGTAQALAVGAGAYLTFEFDTPQTALSFVFTKRAFIFSIELYA